MAITGSSSGGPFVISHGACDRSHLICISRRPAPSSLYPARQSSAHPHRFGQRDGAHLAHRQQRKMRGVETSHMRLKTCTTLGWCFETSHPRGRAPSASRPGLAGRGRGWWRLRDGKGHPDHSFLLIDVDRTGSGGPCPPLTLRQTQIRLPRAGRADPPHLRLRTSLVPRAG